MFEQVFVRREPDAFEEPASASDTAASAYRISHPVHASSTLSDALLRELTTAAEAPVVEGLNACADSFYSSQARLGSHFDDRNEHLLNALKTRYPEVSMRDAIAGVFLTLRLRFVWVLWTVLLP